VSRIVVRSKPRRRNSASAVASRCSFVARPLSVLFLNIVQKEGGFGRGRGQYARQRAQPGGQDRGPSRMVVDPRKRPVKNRTAKAADSRSSCRRGRTGTPPLACIRARHRRGAP